MSKYWKKYGIEFKEGDEFFKGASYNRKMKINDSEIEYFRKVAVDKESKYTDLLNILSKINILIKYFKNNGDNHNLSIYNSLYDQVSQAIIKKKKIVDYLYPEINKREINRKLNIYNDDNKTCSYNIKKLAGQVPACNLLSGKVIDDITNKAMLGELPVTYENQDKYKCGLFIGRYLSNLPIDNKCHIVNPIAHEYLSRKTKRNAKIFNGESSNVLFSIINKKPNLSVNSESTDILKIENPINRNFINEIAQINNKEIKDIIQEEHKNEEIQEEIEEAKNEVVNVVNDLEEIKEMAKPDVIIPLSKHEKNKYDKIISYLKKHKQININRNIAKFITVDDPKNVLHPLNRLSIAKILNSSLRPTPNIRQEFNNLNPGIKNDIKKNLTKKQFQHDKDLLDKLAIKPSTSIQEAVKSIDKPIISQEELDIARESIMPSSELLITENVPIITSEKTSKIDSTHMTTRYFDSLYLSADNILKNMDKLALFLKNDNVTYADYLTMMEKGRRFVDECYDVIEYYKNYSKEKLKKNKIKNESIDNIIKNLKPKLKLIDDFLDNIVKFQNDNKLRFAIWRKYKNNTDKPIILEEKHVKNLVAKECSRINSEPDDIANIIKIVTQNLNSIKPSNYSQMTMRYIYKLIGDVIDKYYDSKGGINVKIAKNVPVLKPQKIVERKARIKEFTPKDDETESEISVKKPKKTQGDLTEIKSKLDKTAKVKLKHVLEQITNYSKQITETQKKKPTTNKKKSSKEYDTWSKELTNLEMKLNKYKQQFKDITNNKFDWGYLSVGIESALKEKGMKTETEMINKIGYKIESENKKKTKSETQEDEHESKKTKSILNKMKKEPLPKTKMVTIKKMEKKITTADTIKKKTDVVEESAKIVLSELKPLQLKTKKIITNEYNKEGIDKIKNIISDVISNVNDKLEKKHMDSKNVGGALNMLGRKSNEIIAETIAELKKLLTKAPDVPDSDETQNNTSFKVSLGGNEITFKKYTKNNVKKIISACVQISRQLYIKQKTILKNAIKKFGNELDLKSIYDKLSLTNNVLNPISSTKAIKYLNKKLGVNSKKLRSKSNVNVLLSAMKNDVKHEYTEDRLLRKIRMLPKKYRSVANTLLNVLVNRITKDKSDRTISLIKPTFNKLLSLISTKKGKYTKRIKFNKKNVEEQQENIIEEVKDKIEEVKDKIDEIIEEKKEEAKIEEKPVENKSKNKPKSKKKKGK